MRGTKGAPRICVAYCLAYHLDQLHGQRSSWLGRGELPVRALMPQQTDVPIWDGDPSSFDSFATSCKWYERSLKESDRKLAAPRIWQKLHGAAKSVVKNLKPEDFDVTNGVEKLPLGTLVWPQKSPRRRYTPPDHPRGGALHGTTTWTSTSSIRAYKGRTKVYGCWNL